jgi:hypothetical protein
MAAVHLVAPSAVGDARRCCWILRAPVWAQCTSNVSGETVELCSLPSLLLLLFIQLAAAR